MAPVWTMAWNYCFAHGWIRYPLALVPPLALHHTLEGFLEQKFKELNAGHNQIDIWQRVAQKVKDLEAEE